LDELEELLFELINFLGHEEWVDEREIRIRQVAVIPDLLCNQEGAQDQGAPVRWLQGHLSKRDQPVDIDEADNAALGTI
jgi:hypothetical protein